MASVFGTGTYLQALIVAKKWPRMIENGQDKPILSPQVCWSAACRSRWYVGSGLLR
jgi:hypothetical protein